VAAAAARGYLGGWFLYLTILAGLLGALFSGFPAQYPAVNLDGLRSLANYKFIFPILFITVACGACSGFHGIVSSGTTSKQIKKESDTLRVGYGAMLLEALVAVLAIATLMIIPKGDAILKGDPNLVYANGLARYMGLAGIGFNLALTFALLAFSTFVYDTLDVCTRLARYIMQELLGLKGNGGAWLAALLTLIPPFIFLMLSKEKAYLVAWPIFGTSNQLMASLILLVLAVWLKGTGRSPWVALVPMLFMMVVTLASLVVQIVPFFKLLAGKPGGPDTVVSGVCGLVLLVLAVWLIAESVRSLKQRTVKAS
jgi:carbon starvation protein